MITYSGKTSEVISDTNPSGSGRSSTHKKEEKERRGSEIKFQWRGANPTRNWKEGRRGEERRGEKKGGGGKEIDG